MLNYNQLICEEPSFRAYHALVGTMAMRDEIPIKICRFDNVKKTTFVFIVMKSTGKIKTYRAETSKVDAPFFSAWIAGDFPQIEFERTEC